MWCRMIDILQTVSIAGLALVIVKIVKAGL
jgi:hypothetical protein